MTGEHLKVHLKVHLVKILVEEPQLAGIILPAMFSYRIGISFTLASINRWAQLAHGSMSISWDVLIAPTKNVLLPVTIGFSHPNVEKDGFQQAMFKGILAVPPKATPPRNKGLIRPY